MSEPEQRLCDASGLATILDVMADEIARTRWTSAPLRLIGIRSRGFPLASRLAERVASRAGLAVPVGAVDITLYRDDLDSGGRWPVLHGTEIPFDVEGADVVLVDDVLYTGRTVRAALNTVCDLGRPARVRLAVLVDRGHRELPIQADIIGQTLATEPHEQIRVRLTPNDARDEIVRLGRR